MNKASPNAKDYTISYYQQPARSSEPGGPQSSFIKEMIIRFLRHTPSGPAAPILLTSN